MIEHSQPAGFWKHSRAIIIGLTLLFIVAVIVDVFIWLSMKKRTDAVENLNELMAGRPTLETKEEKIQLLDTIIAAHTEAQAYQTDGTASAGASTSVAPLPPERTIPDPTDPKVQQKSELLDAILKKYNQQ